MAAPSAGIHHVTGIAGSPQNNLDFYAGVLGLRLVKRTVNFDDPGTYHLYYGDEAGRPGTILTFFPWPRAVRGRSGGGMTTATAFGVPAGSIDFWMDRLAHLAHEFLSPVERFGERVLPLFDPDGLPLELVERGSADAAPGWRDGPVRADRAVLAMHSVSLATYDLDATCRVLVDALGMTEVGTDGQVLRLVASGDAAGNIVDLVDPGESGRSGAGTIHHVAFRATDDDHQAALADAVRQQGLQVTDVKDRQYFRSVYFREPGGILFEIATDGPGFTADEPPEHLGEALKLPPWLENRRPELERRLPEISAPEVASS